MTHRKNAHCSYCGTAFGEGKFPKRCAACAQTTWLNPTPVAVLIVPVGTGVMTIRRGIPPHVGQLALPGGFVEVGETWQEAGAREVREEAQANIDPAGVRDLAAMSPPDGGVLLVFGVARPLALEALSTFQPTSETTERVVVEEPVELAFPLHTEALRLYFRNR